MLHRVHYLIVLARSETPSENRHAGLTQFIVDTTTEGLDIRPILNLSGGHEFNEVFFRDCFVPDDMVIGKPGEGWTRVTGELAYERAGPDRFMSDIRLLIELVEKVGTEPSERQAIEIGRFVSHFASAASHVVVDRRIAGARRKPGHRGRLGQGCRHRVRARNSRDRAASCCRSKPASRTTTTTPSRWRMCCYTRHRSRIRGGTPEILRGMIARGLGLR